MHSQMTIGKKLVFCFAAMLIAMFGLGTSSWYSMGKLGSLLDTAVNKTATKLELCGHLSKTLSDMVSQERSIALRASIKDWGNVEQHKRTFAAKIAEADNDLKEIGLLLVTDAGRQAIDSLQTSLTAWQGAHHRGQNHARPNDRAAGSGEGGANPEGPESGRRQRGCG